MVDPAQSMGIGRVCAAVPELIGGHFPLHGVTKEKQKCTLFISQILHRRPVQNPAVYGCRGAAQDYTMRWCCWRLTSGCEPGQLLWLRAKAITATQGNCCEPRELPPSKRIGSTQRVRTGTIGRRNLYYRHVDIRKEG